MTVINNVWELSLAYEQHCHERREHVAKLLDQWGGGHYNSWPVKAEVGRLETPPMTVSWFHQIASLGATGIHRSIEGQHLPGVNWRTRSTYDVWFCPIYTGTNVNVLGAELGAYIIDWVNQQVVYCHLGCTHQSPSIVVRGQLKTYSCISCGKKWEVDSSD